RPPSRSTLVPYTTLFRSVGMGQQVSEIQRQFRNGEATFQNDFLNLANPGEMPAFWFTSYNQPAFMNAADEKSDPSYSSGMSLNKDRKSTRLNSSHEWISY